MKADPKTHYDEATNAVIGRAAGALIEFLGLKQDCLEEAGVLSRSSTAAFTRAYGYKPEKERIAQIPPALTKAYRDQHRGENPPEIALCDTVEAMLEKGSQLASLKREDLRAGTRWMLQERGKDRHELAGDTGLSYSAITSFLKGGNLSTHNIAKIARALDMEDIFALEQVGREATKAPIAGAASSLGI